MVERTNEMLFPINGESTLNFYTGSLPEKRQALITLSEANEIVVAVFDFQGELLDVIREALAWWPVISDDVLDAENLQQKFGLTPGPVRVKAFRLPGGELAVYRLPDEYQRFLDEPNSPEFDTEKRMTFPSLIEDWEREGLFVLEVGQCDFWLNQTGEVIAT